MSYCGNSDRQVRMFRHLDMFRQLDMFRRLAVLTVVGFAVWPSISAQESVGFKTERGTEAEISPIVEMVEMGSGDVSVTDSRKPFYMAAKTNMLFDVALIPNISAEFYLGHNVSVSGEWMYTWLSSNRRHRYWRIYGGDVSARYWFGAASEDKPLIGHHAGIYIGAFTFDVEWGGTGYMGGRPEGTIWDRCILNVGAEYGYSLPISRHLNIDFTIGVGYLGGLVDKYYPEDGRYIIEERRRRHWVGPTKAEVSLVWLLGRGNVNSMKRK